ncbi:MAG: hypothetical protein KHZ58_10680 [Hungatella hathewayi]|nr:hypothetical protein [Hungatella hathewayi]
MAIKKILKYAVTAVVCIATCGTVWASSTDTPPTVATESVSGAADGMYNEFSMTGKVKAVDIISVVMPSDIVFNIECDKDDGAISKIQSGVGEIRNNSNQNMDLSVIAVQDDSNGDGSTFLQTVNLYLAEDNKTLDEIKALSEAKLESGAQNKKITTLQRSSSQQIRLYGEAASDTSRLQKERYTIQVTMKISKAPAN